MDCPLVLRLLLRGPGVRVFCHIHRLAPAIDGSLGVGTRELRSCPGTAPGTDALAVENRVDLVPAFVSRIVDPGALDEKDVAAATRGIVASTSIPIIAIGTMTASIRPRA